MEFNNNLLEKLTAIYGPSGREQKVREFISEEIKEYVDDIKIDALGNLIAHKHGTGKKIMFSGHMDQIGLLVTDIDEKGFVRITNVGGIPVIRILDQRVVFPSGAQGVVRCEKIDSPTKLKIDKLYVDLCVTSKEEAEKITKIGDVCVSFSNYYDNENFVIANCLDDRIGCYCMIEALKQNIDTENDLYFVFSVQEEVGCRGAKTAGYAVNPDYCFALDVTATGDDLSGIKMAVKCGNGAAIKIKDNSILVPEDVIDIMSKTAADNEIKYQYEVLEFGGTDSGAVHLTREGIKCGVISIPSRNIHSGNEIVNKYDVNECIKLAKALAEKKY